MGLYKLHKANFGDGDRKRKAPWTRVMKLCRMLKKDPHVSDILVKEEERGYTISFVTQQQIQPK